MKTIVLKALLKIVLPWLLNNLSSVKFFKKLRKMKKRDVIIAAVIKIAKFGNELGEALEDRKISVTEAVGFLDNLVGFWSIVNDWPEIKTLWPSYKNDPVKRQELIAAVKEEFDLSNDKIEIIIEKGFDVIEKTYELLLAIRS